MQDDAYISQEKHKTKNLFQEYISNINNSINAVYLSDIAIINPKTNDLPNFFNYIDLESVDSGILKHKKSISKEEAPSRAKRVLSKNDILYQTVRPYQKNNLFFEFEDGNYVASTGYAQIRAKKNINPKYLYYLLHSNKFVNNVLVRCTGTSYPAINSNDLKKIKINVSDINTQNKIANFLTLIDKKITLMQKTLVLYQKLEKQIRKDIFDFKENSIDFNKYSLGEIAHIKKGFTPSTQNEEYWKNGTYKWLSIADMDKKYLTNTKKKITEKAIINKDIIPKETLVMSFKLSIGKLAILKEPMFSNEAIANFKWKTEDILTEYMYFYLKTINILKYGSQAAKGITLNNETLNSIPIFLPSFENQQKIVKVLLSFNNKLDLIKLDLEKEKRFKKGLLQKMFV